MSRVLLTGGSMGIGLEVARALAEQGHTLMLVARGAEALEQAAETLPGQGHTWHPFDVADDSAWSGLELIELHGLVCAAGVM